MTDQITDTFYVNFYDEISMQKVKVLMSILSEIIIKENPSSIYCLFSSPGGHVEPGIVLYNYLKSLPVNLIMHNIGNIDSIANIVFLAGNERYATRFSSFMFHGITQIFSQNTGLNRNQLTETINGMNASEQKIAGIITERTRLKIEEIMELFNIGDTKNAQYAKDNEIIKEIKEIKIPKNSKMLSINIQNAP